MAVSNSTVTGLNTELGLELWTENSGSVSLSLKKKSKCDGIRAMDYY